MKINEKEYLVEAKYVDGEKPTASGEWVITINGTNLFRKQFHWNRPFATFKVYYKPNYNTDDRTCSQVKFDTYIEGFEQYQWISIWRDIFDWLLYMEMPELYHGLSEWAKDKLMEMIYDAINKEDFVIWQPIEYHRR